MAVGILAVIALAHVSRLGTYLRDPLFTLYYSYFSDITVPFGMYFLLCASDDRLPVVADWHVRTALVFGIASLTEVLQAFGLPLLGRTFDPLDVIMFAVGVGLAVFMDRVLLTRLLPHWSPQAAV